MLKLAFPPATIEALRYERLHHPHPRVQLKMEALYLKSQGLAEETIQCLCVISKATYDRYLQEFGMLWCVQPANACMCWRRSTQPRVSSSLSNTCLGGGPITPILCHTLTRGKRYGV